MTRGSEQKEPLNFHIDFFFRSSHAHLMHIGIHIFYHPSSSSSTSFFEGLYLAVQSNQDPV